MTFELLVSCVKKDPHELAAQMNIASDAVIVSQLEEKDSEETFELAGNMVRAIKSTTRGVGLNRNICIENSTADIILFADEDIVYEKEYAYTVVNDKVENTVRTISAIVTAEHTRTAANLYQIEALLRKEA